MTPLVPREPFAKLTRRCARRVLSPLAAVLVLAAPAGAQSWRTQAAWVHHNLAGVLVGVEGRRLLGSPPPLPGAGPGPIVAGTRDWMVTGMVGAGIDFDPAGSSSVLPIFYGHLGVLRRTGSDVLTRVGVIGAGYARERAFGPQVFLELEGIAGVQAGVLHTPGGWEPGVGISVVLRFLNDIFG